MKAEKPVEVSRNRILSVYLVGIILPAYFSTSQPAIISTTY